jgi:A/G-specific adenine glycosylase
VKDLSGKDDLGARLLAWYRAEQRDLPWRREPTPYAVWVSEIMLQQTRVATVIPYFERWMARFPTIEALAAAEEADVLHAWQGLGYYSRARNLRRGAQEVIARYGGRVPNRVEELLTLPGVGRYTAGAIASIAYNQPGPIVDGNVIRVISRLFALRGDPKKAPLQGEIWRRAEELIPEGQARDFNPALMELGATVCTPQNPHCSSCPVAELCEANKLGIQDELPELAQGPAITPVRMVAGLVWRGERVLLVQRRATESRWAGMWQFPNTEVNEGESDHAAVQRAVNVSVGLSVEPGSRAALIRHSVTRYRITLEAFHCSSGQGEPSAAGCQDWRWATAPELQEYALPAAHRAIADRIGTGAIEEHAGQLDLGLRD